jgi:hypothetical protein
MTVIARHSTSVVTYHFLLQLIIMKFVETFLTLRKKLEWQVLENKVQRKIIRTSKLSLKIEYLVLCLVKDAIHSCGIW